MWRDDRKIRSEELRSIFTRDSTRKDEFNLCNNEFSNIMLHEYAFFDVVISREISRSILRVECEAFARQRDINFI